jgi:hypothetical protein
MSNELIPKSKKKKYLFVIRKFWPRVWARALNLFDELFMKFVIIVFTYMENKWVMYSF